MSRYQFSNQVTISMKPLNLFLSAIILLIADVATGQELFYENNGIELSYSPKRIGTATAKNGQTITAYNVRVYWTNNSGKTYNMTVGMTFRYNNFPTTQLPDQWRAQSNKHYCSINPGTYSNRTRKICEMVVFTTSDNIDRPGFSGGGGNFK